MNKTFDALPSPYHMGDVSFTLLAATFKNALKEDFQPDKDLLSTTLVTEDGQVTNGGLLLCDQGVLSQSRIFCTRWKGTHKGNIDADALDDKEYQGASLISLLQNAEDFIRNNSKNPWSIRGMTREERSDYPYKAVREVLVNALIHRDYQVLGSEIHIEMFDDRMEISSPGGMANGRRIQDMDLQHIPSMRRNQVISDVFSRLHYMERRGSGIDRIMTSYAECAQKPIFYSDSTFFLVTLPNRSVAAPAQLSMDSENVETSAQNMETTIKNVETSTHNVETSAFSTPIEKLEHDLSKLRMQTSTKEKILELFRRYGYEYEFRTSHVADVFHVKNSRANLVIRELTAAGILESPSYGTYRFISK